jgi:ABC-2 type transport system ATP-binding protein
MLQRVGLAQAMLNEPRVVFLDEPTSGLDPIGRLLVRDIIHDLRDQGTTVFLNSHLLGEVEATCDRVVFIKQGRTIRELTLNAVEQGLEVELKLGSTGPELLAGLGRFGTDVVEREGIVTLRVTDEAVLPDLARWLVTSGADLFTMHSRRPSLEALFLEVMGGDQRPG